MRVPNFQSLRSPAWAPQGSEKRAYRVKPASRSNLCAFRVVLALADMDRATQKQLAEDTGCDIATVSRCVREGVTTGVLVEAGIYRGSMTYALSEKVRHV